MKTKTVLLKKVEINKLKKEFLLWKFNTQNTQISKTVTFKGHVDALVFIARITVHAQVMNHHPEINFTYRTVKITLCTHELKGLSKLDVELARKIDKLKTVDK